MFRGSFSHTLDDKGRVIIPARFRNIIQTEGGDAVILTEKDNCLYGYTLNEWSAFEKRIKSMADMSDTFRRYLRRLVGSVQECTFDKQGRIVIPPEMRSYAGLEKEVELVGVLDHFEIWSPENRTIENEKLEKELQQVEVRNEIAKLGL